MGFTDGSPTNQTHPRERRGSHGDSHGPGITTGLKKRKVFPTCDLPLTPPVEEDVNDWQYRLLRASPGYRRTTDSEDVSAEVVLTDRAA